MNDHPFRHLDADRLALANRFAVRLADRPHADDITRQAVAVLTADADPLRADRLHPGPGEAARLVERLAVWALHYAGDDAVTCARWILDEDDRPVDDHALCAGAVVAAVR